MADETITKPGIDAALPRRLHHNAYVCADPDGLAVEFTRDVENVEAIDARQRATAHAALARWTAGDATPNNDVRPH